MEFDFSHLRFSLGIFVIYAKVR